MTGLPPPTGTPLAYAIARDPWAIQAQRHEKHQHARRQRRRQRASRGALALLVAAAAVGGSIGLARSGLLERDTMTEVSAPTSRAVVALDAPVGAVDAEAVAGPPAVSVDEVWLLDRQNGQFDWGFVLSSDSPRTLVNLDVAIEFVDAAGETVHAEAGTITALAPGVEAAFGGVADEPFESSNGVSAPTQLTVAVDLDAVSAEESAASPVEIVDLARVGSGRLDAADELSGGVVVGRDASSDAVRNGTIVAVWRDANDAVIAAIVEDIRLRSGNDRTSFNVQLDRQLVPAGLPSNVWWGPRLALGE